MSEDRGAQRASYQPSRATELAESKYSDILPSQHELKESHIDAYRQKIKNGEQLEPIPVARSSDGKKLVLIDGHHRFAAAMAEQAKVDLIVSSTTAPTSHADWSGVKKTDRFTGNDIVNQGPEHFANVSSDSEDYSSGSSPGGHKA
ncbi:ParB N-terminal domain-containing protein [Trinickia diaoshuihuensis]|jgi:hypothetical protein|uniref:ParB N-terminal domain-containing protein n=1 Tax=Trinickia diaoshuihuensis TaxID=2292265 RepID=UPI0013C2D6C5|nr:ParB N-terminal domain-containing protein [Trinickia diaoshuihuensis]